MTSWAQIKLLIENNPTDCSQYYEVQELFDLRDKANDDPDFPKQIKNRLNSLCDQLDPNDNPVFLIAKMK